jgi:hypothetical protein
MTVTAQQIFAPDGFDTNDSIEVVLVGELSESCIVADRAEFALNPNTKDIVLTQYARRIDGDCVPQRSQFSSVINLGTLPVGEYVIKSEGAQDRFLIISPPHTTMSDDFLYAQVLNATVLNPSPGRYVAVLSGQINPTCQEWQEIRVLDEEDVIVVLPILHKTGPQTCDTELQSFEKTIELPWNMTDGMHLLHIRTTNSQSINQLFIVE